MYVLGTICCRAGSKGVKNKNIRMLAGKPLVSYTLETALLCSGVQETLVSTDSPEVAELARLQGIRMILDRPAALATDDASKWPVFVHAIEQYESIRSVEVDYIIDMDATAPLKTREDMEGALRMALEHPDADVVITAYDAESNPYFNMMETGRDGFAVLSKQSPGPLVCRQHAPAVYSLSPAAFVIKKSALYRFEHWSQARCMLYRMPRERAVDIDTEMDFRFVAFLLEHQKEK